MITIISGRLGCGKSYLAVKMMQEHLYKGGIVATNIMLKNMSARLLGRVVHIDGNCLPTDLPSGDRRGHGKRRIMIVIDEALSWFGIAENPKNDPRKGIWADWLRHSDKLGQDIFLISQDWAQTVKWIRVLSQRVWFCHNSKNERFIRHLPFKFLFAAEKNTIDVENQTAGLPARAIRTRLYFLSKSVYNCYDTAETFESERFESENYYERYSICPKSKDRALVVYCSTLLFAQVLLTAFLLWQSFSPIDLKIKSSPSFFQRFLPDKYRPPSTGVARPLDKYRPPLTASARPVN